MWQGPLSLMGETSIILFPAIGMFVACLALLGYGLAQWWVNEGYRRQVRAAERTLCPHLVGSDRLDLEIFEAMGDYGRAPVLEVLRTARRQLKGRCSDAIADALRDLGEIHRLEAAARSGWRRRRVAALWGLGECGGAEASAVIRGALLHSDPQTRLMARESALITGSPELVLSACRCLLREKETELEASRRFVKWACTRFSDLVEKLLEERQDITSVHRHSFEAALQESLGWRAEASLGAVGRGASRTTANSPVEPKGLSLFEIGRSIERVVSAAGTLGRVQGVNDDWLDSRTRRLDTMLGLRMMASEVALGLALLTGAVAGGGLAWLFYG